MPLIELRSLDLDSECRSGRQPPRHDLDHLAVWKRPEQAAIRERGQAPAHLLLTKEADHAVLICCYKDRSRRRGDRLCWHSEPRRNLIHRDQVLAPLMSRGWCDGHVDDAHRATAIFKARCL